MSEEKPFVVCGTGHRPNKIGGYGPVPETKLLRLAQSALAALRDEHGPLEVISGMALGWDTALARAALSLEIPFVAAIPFLGQEKMWPSSSQDSYNDLLRESARQIIVCEGKYAPWKMLERNKWMVDNSDLVLALWDGSKGGTGHCVSYAKEKNKEILNLWEIFCSA